MAQEKTQTRLRGGLERALKQRLNALTLGLTEAEVGGKGIDLVREIKELHMLLEALRQQNTPAPKEQPRVVVVWGNGGQEVSQKMEGSCEDS